MVRTDGDPKVVIAALRGDLQNIDSHLEALIFDFRAAFTISRRLSCRGWAQSDLR